MLVVMLVVACAGFSSSGEQLASQTAHQETIVAKEWTITPTFTSTPTPTTTPTATITPTRTVTPTPDPRYYDRKGGFSFVPPADWISINVTTPRTDKEWYYPGRENFQCQLSFGVADNDRYVSPKRAAEMDLEMLSAYAPGFRIKYIKPFPTEFSPSAYTLSYFLYLGGSYRDTEFLFAQDVKMIEANFLCKADKMEDSVLNDSMKTLRFEE
jgi:hypothetical protein